MKIIRETYAEDFGQFAVEIRDDNLGRSHILGWVIDNEYFVASENCPKFDPRDGSPLTYIQELKAYEAYQENKK